MEEQAREQLVNRLKEVDDRISELIFYAQSRKWGKVMGVRDRKAIGVISSQLREIGLSLTSILVDVTGPAQEQSDEAES